MLIVALVLAVVSLAALVTAVVTSNETIAWVCIGLSALGVVLLVVDAIRDRHHRAAAPADRTPDRTEVIAPVEVTEVIEPVESPEPVEAPESVEAIADYPDDLAIVEDHPDELLFDEPDYDTPSDDEPVYPVPAEEAAIHIVADTDVLSDSERRDDSTTVIYAGEAYTDESSAATESYIVVNSDEPYAVLVDDDSYPVTYADETGDDDSVSADERRESDGER